jgi:hypothetical protein
MKGQNLDWKKKQTKRATPPPKKKEVDVIGPAIAEHVSQCTATSFYWYRTYKFLTFNYAKFNSQHESYIEKYV